MIVGLIPARGGSKGVPAKNVRAICGKPLIAWSILAAQQSVLLDDFYVTTEDAEIAQVSQSYGAKVIDRPKHLAEDSSNVVDAIKHALELVSMEIVVLLQPTSPQRDGKLIDQCISHFQDTKADNLATGAICHIFEYGTTPPNRQETQGYFHNDGAVYIVRAKLVQDAVDEHYKRGIRLGENSEFVYTSEEMHFEIDTEFDFWLVEQILRWQLRLDMAEQE